MLRRHGKAGEKGSHAEVVDLGVSIDVGPPLPHLLADGQRAAVVFLTADFDSAIKAAASAFRTGEMESTVAELEAGR